MADDVTCPVCGEEDDLTGRRADRSILVECGRCGQSWERSLDPACARCGGSDLQAVPHAIVEKGRGTQLSVVGIRVRELCRACDRPTIERWQANRPNPLMPDEMPTFDA